MKINFDKNMLAKFLICILAIVYAVPVSYAQTKENSIVEHYGNLRVEGTHIVNQSGEPIMLTGMSLYWSQWKGKFYNYDCIEWLRDNWKCTVVRAAMAIEAGGYLSNPAIEKNKIKTVVNAAIDLGIYVIIDWHDHNAHNHLNEAVEFFKEMAAEYGEHPNVIYEIYNEPLNTSAWNTVVKPYADSVVSAIRSIDPDNIIIVGTPTWSQDVDIAALNPIDKNNIVYALHYYAAYQYHKQSLRNKAALAIQRGIALFVSEFGTVLNTGDGPVDYDESNIWFEFLEQHKISWCNWSVADLSESSAVLKPGASSIGGWTDDQISPSGLFIRDKIRSSYESIFVSVEPDEQLATKFLLKQNYPNPFNPNTTIMFYLEKNAFVNLPVYSILGENITILVNEQKPSGNYKINFNAQDLPSGVYIYSLTTNNKIENRKMIILK